MTPMDEPNDIPHVLACDIGNSAIKFTAVCGESVDDVHVAKIGDAAELGAAVRAVWNEMPAPKVVVACSVSPAATMALEAAVSQTLDVDVILVGRDVDLPMDTEVDEPEAIGVDRVCVAVAAYDQPGEACVVADFGTAITLDCISDAGVFLGGAILPGLSISADSLAEKTAQLPRVDLAEPPAGPGKDTAAAIQVGLLAAARGAMRHCVESFAEQLGHWPLVICTGGDADLVVGDLHNSELVQAVVPDLALRGVAMAYYRTLLK